MPKRSKQTRTQIHQCLRKPLHRQRATCLLSKGCYAGCWCCGLFQRQSYKGQLEGPRATHNKESDRIWSYRGGSACRKRPLCQVAYERHQLDLSGVTDGENYNINEHLYTRHCSGGESWGTDERHMGDRSGRRISRIDKSCAHAQSVGSLIPRICAKGGHRHNCKHATRYFRFMKFYRYAPLLQLITAQWADIIEKLKVLLIDFHR